MGCERGRIRSSQGRDRGVVVLGVEELRVEILHLRVWVGVGGRVVVGGGSVVNKTLPGREGGGGPIGGGRGMGRVT